MRKVLKLVLMSLLFSMTMSCTTLQKAWYKECNEMVNPIIKVYAAQGYVPAMVEHAPFGGPALVLVNTKVPAYKVVFLFVDKQDREVIVTPIEKEVGKCFLASQDKDKDGVLVEVALGVAQPLPTKQEQAAE